MALTLQNILSSSGGGWCQTFAVPSGYVPAAFAPGMLTVVSSAGAPAATVYAVNAGAATNPVISAVVIPPAATTLLFSEGEWILVK